MIITGEIEEDKNSIIFDEQGIDYIEKLYIELSLYPKDGFVEIHPYLLYKQLNEFKHLSNIIDMYFSNILKRIPNFNDTNDNLPKENRFTVMYYKCYIKLYHSLGHHFGKPVYTNTTLDSLLYYIKKQNHSIVIPK